MERSPFYLKVEKQISSTQEAILEPSVKKEEAKLIFKANGI